eukprot:CAMPEP_0202486120 /NCGR_PEP_ID=MMETSP1361-20130828/4767_1 /ASSEMBLY_ACC=CAM_ASM_000849 /TAXON_ID=210615 /ORGANISM="Staurosira complex sp., Strain CCMP2646" /LENGTH=681 /DNA_ID=CAMNT_0049115173 /DNA_START=176 /DNA_END=2221 /DNA_ORIENTATION=+
MATSLHSFGMRRRNLATFAKKKPSADDIAVSTTKAHLISIVAPRTFTPVLLLENEKLATDKTVATDNSLSADSDEGKGKVSFHPNSKQPAGYTTAEVMASPLAYAAGGFSKDNAEKAVSGQADKSLIQDSVSSMDESRDDDEDDDEEGAEVTPEEAEGIKRNDELDNTEVNVEHLLRVTFKNLFKDKFLVSAPTFTIIDGPAFDNTTSTDSDSWIQIEVMVLPPAIGIVLQRLERIGVGHDVGSVSIYKAELCKASSLSVYKQVQPSKGINGSSDHTTTSETTENLKSIEVARNEWKMAATRLRIEQVREEINGSSEWNFDFIALVTIAGILAGVGLVTNNTVVIVASMLVSPIMGPVLGMTFGARIADWSLVRSSFWVETKAIIVCFLVGALITLCGAWSLIAETWPTNEMQIRGDATGLVVGIAIAVPSGMGVSLSILSGNTGSLVGVAISASLLPPAVNAGICWMYALILIGRGADEASDYAVIGAISFALTVVNIVCIWFSGMAMFTLKEVAPLKKKNAFWERDLKVARRINRREDGQEETPLPPTILEEQTQTAFDIFSFMPFRQNTPMEVTVKHNQRAVDFDASPPVEAELTDVSDNDDHSDYDEEEGHYDPEPTCFGGLAHIFGLDKEDRATIEDSSQHGSLFTFDDETTIERRKKNKKFMYYRKPSDYELNDA